MGNELFDFSDRGNFDFFRYRGIKKSDKESLLLSCEGVLKYAHETVKDICLLGFRLKELKDSDTWREVLTEDGNQPFSYVGFVEFANYAFGISKTRVSDLLRISNFVKLNGDNVDFIDKKYANYNLSQLTEIGSVEEWQRKYFSAKMTVAEMRIVKKYMTSDEFYRSYREEGFNALTAAQEWKARKDRKLSDMEEVEEVPQNVLPGQFTIDDLVKEVKEEDENGEDEKTDDQDSDYEDNAVADEEEDFADAEDVEAEKRTIEEEVEFEESDGANAIDYQKPLSISDGEVKEIGRNPTSDFATYGAGVPEAKEAGNRSTITTFRRTVEGDFTTRDGRRAFLNDYTKWEKKWSGNPYESCYYVYLNNGTGISVTESETYSGEIDEGKTEKTVRFYFSPNGKCYQILVPKKSALENYLGDHQHEI